MAEYEGPGMTAGEKVEALKPYLRHFGDCALLKGGGVCDCGLYRILGLDRKGLTRPVGGR